MKKIFMLLFVFSIIFLGLSNSIQAAGNEIEPFAIGDPLYPNSSLEMKPGDVLYSAKSWSTGLVGHVGIVGTDFKIKEVLVGSPAGRSSTAATFWARHSQGDKITLLKASSGATAAGSWATNNVGKATTYSLTNYNLSTISYNYCSKFVAQAFYYGANISLLFGIQGVLIPPSDIKNSNKLNPIATFTVN